MSLSRRGFLGAMLGAMAAPAVVKAESLMKIIVPKQDIIFAPIELSEMLSQYMLSHKRVGRGFTSAINHVDELAFMNMPEVNEDGLLVPQHMVRGYYSKDLTQQRSQFIKSIRDEMHIQLPRGWSPEKAGEFIDAYLHPTMRAMA